MKILASLGFLALAAFTLPSGVTATTVYEVTQPIVTSNGQFTLPWPSGSGFSMDGRAFQVWTLPPCAGLWTRLPDNPVPPGAYATMIVVDPIPAGHTLYVPNGGFHLGASTETRYFVCR